MPSAVNLWLKRNTWQPRAARPGTASKVMSGPFWWSNRPIHPISGTWSQSTPIGTMMHVLSVLFLEGEDQLTRRMHPTRDMLTGTFLAGHKSLL